MEVNFGNWQSFLDVNLHKIKGTTCLSRFEKAQTDVERISIVLDEGIIVKTSWIAQYFEDCTAKIGQRKSSAAAGQRREEGNVLFQKKKYREALELYNKSIHVAPPESEQRALAYANRSAVLYRTEHYQECLEDIVLALTEGYPQQLRYKVLQRRGQSLLQLGHVLEAKTAFLEAIEALENWGDTDMKSVHLAELKSFLLQVEDGDSDTCNGNFLQRHIPSVPSVSYGQSKVLVQASKAVELKSDMERGRHLVASQEIKPGDTLLVERPFAAVLLPSHYLSHCHHCFGKLLAPLPCEDCSHVRYCSRECQKVSWRVYHRFECPYLDLLHSIGVAHLSLRIILTAGLEKLLDFRRSYLETSKDMFRGISGFTESGTYERNYLSVYELMTHSDNIVPEDMFSYALTSTLLLKLLEQTDFFSHYSHCVDEKYNFASDTLTAKMSSMVVVPTTDNTESQNNLVSSCSGEKLDTACYQDLPNTSNEQDANRKKIDNCCYSDNSSKKRKIAMYIGSLLLRHMCQIVCNAHAITELQVSMTTEASLVESMSQVRVATAIYPTASLMNHSCDPTIISSFCKDLLVGKATKHVKPGGELFTCYGPHCQRMSFSERQEILREQYFFNCDCVACHREQATKQNFQALKCPKCEGPLSQPSPLMTCWVCGHVTEGLVQMQTVLSAQSVFLEGLKDLEQGNVQGGLKSLEKCHELRSCVMFKHHKELGEVKDALARCHATNGNYKVSGDYLRESIDITEAIYGGNSIELANELHKYTEVLFHSKQFSEALKSADHALKIFNLNYGEGHHLVQELQEIKLALNNMT